MLNVILWVGLIVSIPIRGVNQWYAWAALAGIVIMGIAATLVFGLMEGQGRAERVLRWIARKMGLNEDRAGAAVRQIGGRLEDQRHHGGRPDRRGSDHHRPGSGRHARS